MDARTVVLVRDERWPMEPGVCCWRANVIAAFAELGVDVVQTGWGPLPVTAEPADPSAPAARTPSIAGVVTRFLGRAARAAGYGLWRLVRRLARPFVRRLGLVLRRMLASRGRTIVTDSARQPVARPVGDGRPDPRLTGLSTARLVITESAESAVAAVNSGIPRTAVWFLAVPPERAAPGEPVPWAADLREAVPVIGGMIADSLDAAGILERVVGPVRTVVFPPLAADRPCPRCSSDAPVSAPTGPVSECSVPVSSGSLSPAAVTLAPGAGWDEAPRTVPEHLALWRELLQEESEGTPAPRPYSYAVGRLRGAEGPWAPPEREPWGSEPRDDVNEERWAAGPETEWVAATQTRGARALLEETDRNPVVNDEGAAPRRVRIFGHDLKFMHELAEVMDERPDLDVAVDEWRTPGARNDGITENLARTAQTLVAEWARPNAVWLSETKRPDQKLVIRLHRFEIETEYPGLIRQDAVDAVVYIAPHMGQRIEAELGWPGRKLVYIPNYLPAGRLDRPKYPGANFTLGMVGIVPGLKRFDLALDLLAELRGTDPRFSLLVRSQTGWAHKPSWDNPAERRESQRAMERIEKDPLLRGAVVFDPFGRDMAAWFRKVGHILSLSDVEGSHAALGEGMASGAVPVIRGWEGAWEAYGDQWLCDSLDAAVKQVLTCADNGHWRRRSAEAKREVKERFNPGGVVRAWSDLVHGDIEAARAHFAPWVARA